jgi:hypothetical protein
VLGAGDGDAVPAAGTQYDPAPDPAAVFTEVGEAWIIASRSISADIAARVSEKKHSISIMSDSPFGVEGRSFRAENRRTEH